MYRIAVCDDDPLFLCFVEDEIKKYTKKHGIAVSVDTFAECGVVVDRLEDKNVYDAYILDIDMPEYTGLEVAQMVRERAEHAFVIFLTAYDSFAVKGYGPNVLSYVLKDRLYEDLERAFDLLFQQLNRHGEKKLYKIQNQRRYRQLVQDDVIYIYKMQKNAVFVMTDQSEEFDRANLQDVILKLDNPDMFYLDRCVIVNINHVRRITDRVIELTGQHRVTASKSRIMALKEYLT